MESKKQDPDYSLEKLYNRLLQKNLELDERLKEAEEDLKKEKERSFLFTQKIERVNSKLITTSDNFPWSLKKLNKASFN